MINFLHSISSKERFLPIPKVSLFLVILLSSLFSLSVFSQNVIEITPSQDITLYQTDDGSQSNGKGRNFFVGQNSRGELRRALIQFDFAEEFPPNVPILIDSVALTLYLTRANQNSDTSFISIHRIESSWGEGLSEQSGNQGQGVPSEQNDATWLHRFFPDTTWNEIGGDFIPDSSAVTSVSNETNQFITWTGARLVEDVQYWLDNPEENYGWVLVGAEEDGENQSTRGFHSKEIDSIDLKPTLFISFSPVTSNFSHINDIQIDVYPNPSEGIIKLSAKNIQANNLGIVVRNLIGNQLKQFSFKAQQKSIFSTLDLSDLSSGIYFLQISDGKNMETRKIVIR